ncbi:S1 family peptidase [Methyloversatilis thermotolerans]|uniref:S1 family peptidase n=1 Tax=Methyloversatilis thermotolerans TaxID=1346290 RepID=UPI00037BDB57|nr:serine protease [Methyloversatilis thermotolerans]
MNTRRLAHLVAGLFLMCAGSLPASFATAADPEVLARLSRAVLKVSALGDGDRFAVGSAVVVGPDIALTNCHVTRHAHTIVLSRGLERHPVVGERADISRDLCLLRTAGPLPYPALDIRPARALNLGEPVIAHGYSGGMEAHFARGVVLDLHAAGGSYIIQTSAGFLQGASGGGLFDASGRLIGITTFLTSAERTEYFAMPADWADRLRERPEKPPQAMNGSALWEQLPAHQPHFMRLLQPIAAQDWAAVAALSAEWTRDEPHAAAAWLMRARAARMLKQPEQASLYLERALEQARDSEIELQRIERHARLAGLSDVQAAANSALARLRPVPGARP